MTRGSSRAGKPKILKGGGSGIQEAGYKIAQRTRREESMLCSRIGALILLGSRTLPSGRRARAGNDFLGR